jgi:menaquinone-dependent protoporphyrinogen IX oxidase
MTVGITQNQNSASSQHVKRFVKRHATALGISAMAVFSFGTITAVALASVL